jgi:hypothetical protein
VADDTSVGVIDQTVAGASSTKEVRVRDQRLLRDDGTIVTAQTQVVTLVDASGRPVDFKMQLQLLSEIRDLLSDMNLRQHLNQGI